MCRAKYLEKCARTGRLDEFGICKYNSFHHVYKLEMPKHLETCEDQRTDFTKLPETGEF